MTLWEYNACFAFFGCPMQLGGFLGGMQHQSFFYVEDLEPLYAW